MKEIFKELSVVLVLVLMTGCDQDPCDVRHTIVDGECIPDFIYPQNPNLTEGNRFYHGEFGVVHFKNGLWYDVNSKALDQLNPK